MYHIIQGSRTDAAQNPFVVGLKKDNLSYDPLDLTGVAEITACFQKTDGTELMISLTGGGITILGNPILGKIAIALTAAQTALLAVVEASTLELALTYSGDPFKVQIPNAYSVSQSVC